MIPLAVPDLSGREAEYLAECVASTFVSSVGPFVERFEAMTAAATGAQYAIATASGTSAIELALLSVGVGRDDLVVLPSFTFVASANAIRHTGADPWLFDVDAKSWTLDVKLVREAFSSLCDMRENTLIHIESGRRVAAIMPVYACGQPAQMDEFAAIAAEFGVPVLADAAGAIGSTYRDRPLGEICQTSTLSFNGNKTITSGGGGAVLTNSSDVAAFVRHVSTTARLGPGYMHDVVGFNYRMTNLQAAVGCAQLERLDDFVDAKYRIDRKYRERLEGLRLEFFPNIAETRPSNWMTGVVVRRDAGLSVSEFVSRVRSFGVDARPFWIPMHLQPPYMECYRTTMLVSDDLHSRVVTLPSSSNLSDSDQDLVIAAVVDAMRL